MKEWMISIGWDVGGWLSRNNAFCLALATDAGLAWLGQPVILKPEELALLRELDQLVGHIAESQENGAEFPIDLKMHSVYAAGMRTVVAIDAPLGFSREYLKLVTQAAGFPAAGAIEDLPQENFPQAGKKAKYLNNVYGFRETERFVEREFGKRPLSAPFDFLGNNASLAVNARLLWEKQGFKTHPFSPFSGKSNKSVIEVYPGLFKGGGPQLRGRLEEMRRISRQFRPEAGKALSGFDYYLEPDRADDIQPRKLSKTDECDALICALMGLGLWLKEPPFSLNTEIPEALQSAASTEGWIYVPD